MTQAVAEELRGTGVHVSMLCPGPVATEFGETARVKFRTIPYSSEKLAEHAVREMFAGKQMICENAFSKAMVILGKFVPERVMAFGVRLFQSQRERV